jgi:PIN domain nuclease of toxin-antitoxin system
VGRAFLAAVARAGSRSPGTGRQYPRVQRRSLWEVAIKRGLGREDFCIDPRLLRRGLVDNGYEELAILGQHTAAVDGLPPLHKDPFDRLLIAQSLIEGITLLTVDPLVPRYPAPIQAL